jgi:hypothetical protein
MENWIVIIWKIIYTKVIKIIFDFSLKGINSKISLHITIIIQFIIIITCIWIIRHQNEIIYHQNEIISNGINSSKKRIIEDIKFKIHDTATKKKTANKECIDHLSEKRWENECYNYLRENNPILNEYSFDGTRTVRESCSILMKN